MSKSVVPELVLTDKDQFPTEEIIFSHIGKCSTLWKFLFEQIHVDHPEISEQWNYYRDGKSWLLKVTRKSKTVFWLSVHNSSFNIAFYFSDKADKIINESKISDELKLQFNGTKGKKFRSIVISPKTKKDVKNILLLIDVKKSIK